MALINSHTMREESREARRRNGRQSRGAATPAGRERSRAANLRHGLYSRARHQALRALGEDPGELAALVAGAHEHWRPVNTYQSAMVERLAQLQWCMDRAARRRDSLAAAEVASLQAKRGEQALELRRRQVDRLDFLSQLQSHAERADFYAPVGYIQAFTQVFKGRSNPQREAILELLHRLGKPPGWRPALGVSLPQATDDDGWQEFLEEQEVEDEDRALPLADIPVAEGDERDACREELRQKAAEEEQTLQAAQDRLLKEFDAPLTQAERDQAVLSLDPQMEKLWRHEESCFRQFWRLSTLLMKMQETGEWGPGEPEAESRPQAAARRRDGGPRGMLEPEPGPPVAEVQKHGRGAEYHPLEAGARNSNLSMQDSEAAPHDLRLPASDRQAAGPNGGRARANIRENDGASGDIVENTGVDKIGGVTDDPRTVCSSAPPVVDGSVEASAEDNSGHSMTRPPKCG